jgi:hypothetical protein
MHDIGARQRQAFEQLRETNDVAPACRPALLNRDRLTPSLREIANHLSANRSQTHLCGHLGVIEKCNQQNAAHGISDQRRRQASHQVSHNDDDERTRGIGPGHPTLYPKLVVNGRQLVSARCACGSPLATSEKPIERPAAKPDHVNCDSRAQRGGISEHATAKPDHVSRLEQDGFRVLTHSRVPTNDDGIGFGQAVVAADRDRVASGLSEKKPQTLFGARIVIRPTSS